MADGSALNITLRTVTHDDLPILFEHQRDPEANYMVGFGAKDPDDREAFMARWANILAKAELVKMSILLDEEIVGSIMAFDFEDEFSVGYWIDKAHWGKGIATKALTLFLQDIVTRRPIYARVVKDNAGSKRVLEKCGFTITGEDKGFANGRGAEVEEYILILE